MKFLDSVLQDPTEHFSAILESHFVFVNYIFQYIPSGVHFPEEKVLHSVLVSKVVNLTGLNLTVLMYGRTFLNGTLIANSFVFIWQRKLFVPLNQLA